MIARLRRDEQGFTLMELLVTMSIGMVVMMGVFALLDLSVESQAQTADRVDGVQRARLAMDGVTQRLRSLTCPEDVEDDPATDADDAALIGGEAQSVRFFAAMGAEADFSRGTGNAQRPLEPHTPLRKHTLRWENEGDGRLYEDVYTRTWDPATASYSPWSTTPTTRLLAEGIQPLENVPMFVYERRRGDNTAPRVLAPPLDLTERASVGVVRVTFTAAPRLAGRDTGATLQSRVVLRKDDPTDVDDEFECA